MPQSTTLHAPGRAGPTDLGRSLLHPAGKVLRAATADVGAERGRRGRDHSQAREASSRPPLVCSSGRPTVAVVTLLRQLGAKGGVLRQHADFDASGLAITAWLAERAGTIPWRMTADDYLAAVECRRTSERPRLGPVPDTPWDLGLQHAMAEIGTAVFEEELRAELLASMARQSP